MVHRRAQCSAETTLHTAPKETTTVIAVCSPSSSAATCRLQLPIESPFKMRNSTEQLTVLIFN